MNTKTNTLNMTNKVLKTKDNLEVLRDIKTLFRNRIENLTKVSSKAKEFQSKLDNDIKSIEQEISNLDTNKTIN